MRISDWSSDVCSSDLAPLVAANRELQEEAGYAARSLHHLRMLTLSPRYMSHQAHVIVARDLYPQRLPGDEPEELELVPWKLDALHELVLREDFSEGRAVAALFMRIGRASGRESVWRDVWIA